MRIMTRFGVAFAHFNAEEVKAGDFQRDVAGCEAVICGTATHYKHQVFKKGEPAFGLYFKDGKWRYFRHSFHEGYEWEHLSKAIAICLSLHKMDALP